MREKIYAYPLNNIWGYPSNNGISYIKGQKYFYNYKDNIVKDNEELVAIRKEKSISK